jgi:monoamine oxidase
MDRPAAKTSMNCRALHRERRAALPQNDSERLRIGLRDLQTLYPSVDIQGQYLESFAVAWPLEWSTGNTMFFPGQFRTLFNTARAPEGNVFFAAST